MFFNPDETDNQVDNNQFSKLIADSQAWYQTTNQLLRLGLFFSAGLSITFLARIAPIFTVPIIIFFVIALFLSLIYTFLGKPEIRSLAFMGHGVLLVSILGGTWDAIYQLLAVNNWLILKLGIPVVVLLVLFIGFKFLVKN